MIMLSRSVLGFTLAAFMAGSGAAGESPTPKPRLRMPPDYPLGAWNNEISGHVSARLTVDSDGDVTNVEIVSEEPGGWGFAEESKAAFEQWVYPEDVPGIYEARFKYVYKQVALTADEQKLPPAGPPIYVVAPDYPRLSVRRAVTGEAIIVLIHDETGVVTNVRVSSEHPAGMGYGEFVRQAVLTWRFQPGSPGVKSLMFRYRFTLR